jgi:toluene monooxygenase electron transfer component
VLIVDIKIESRAGIASFAAEGPDSILYAGLASGLTLPYDCATGTCGMCKARVRSGSVEVMWPEAPALAKLQRDKGDILMCQSRATGDCVLRVPANVVMAEPGHAPRHRSGQIAGVKLLTADVMHFEVTLAEPMAFAAGQFVVLTLQGLEGGRAYSMVNHTARTHTLELVIKNKPTGGLSERLFSADPTGLHIGVFGPLGRAVFKPAEDRDLVCIAGGSGIAGILSILEHASASGHFNRHKGRVFFGVRTLADGFYLDRFARLIAAANGALEVVLAHSHESDVPSVHPHHASIKLATGFVHEVADAMLDADCAAVSSFVAGPPPMVDGAIRTLIGHSVPASSIRYDKFG